MDDTPPGGDNGGSDNTAPGVGPNEDDGPDHGDGTGLNGVDGLDTPNDGRGPAESDVLGQNESSPGGAGPDEAVGDDEAAPVAEETEPGAGGDDDESLPFTGLGLIAILAVGAPCAWQRPHGPPLRAPSGAVGAVANWSRSPWRGPAPFYFLSRLRMPNAIRD